MMNQPKMEIYNFIKDGNLEGLKKLYEEDKNVFKDCLG